MDREKSINPGSPVVRSIVAGIVMFLFVHLVEVSLSYLLHEYKLLSVNILYYSLTYLIFGVLFGLALGIIISVAAILDRNRKRTGQELSSTFLGVSAFIWLYAVVVFNADAPSNWSLPSHASLLTGLYPRENGTGSQMNAETYSKIEEKLKALAYIQ